MCCVFVGVGVRARFSFLVVFGIDRWARKMTPFLAEGLLLLNDMVERVGEVVIRTMRWAVGDTRTNNFCSKLALQLRTSTLPPKNKKADNSGYGKDES